MHGKVRIRLTAALVCAIVILLTFTASELPSSQATRVGAVKEEQASTQTAVPAARPTPDLLQASYAEIGQPAIDFALSDLDGNTVWLSDYSGKVVIISFWATWCPPCQAEIPELVELYPALQADGVVILAVNFQETADTVDAFAQEMNMNFPVLLDTQGYLAYVNGVRALPTSLFVDRQGVLRYSYMGSLTEDSLNSILAEIDQK
ncbi:MAG: TlpA family protein disulfide reductase [Chloroflexi bacterium]|nr:TlpA family protein disulfide reductase [Chloroflexota bacterium]